MKVRVCPSCGKHNLENAFNCVDCGTTMSINTLTNVAENETPPTRKPDTNVVDHNTTKAPQVSHSEDEAKVIITCENCGQKLRVPLRRKNLHVACPTCKHEFNYEFVEATVVKGAPVNKQSTPPPVTTSSTVTNTSSQPAQRRCPKCGGYKISNDTASIHMGLVIVTLGVYLWVLLLAKLLNIPFWTTSTLRCEICGYEWKE